MVYTPVTANVLTNNKTRKSLKEYSQNSIHAIKTTADHDVSLMKVKQVAGLAILCTCDLEFWIWVSECASIPDNLPKIGPSCGKGEGKRQIERALRPCSSAART